MGFSGHQARKRFGQHWLKDQTVLARIADAADLQSRIGCSRWAPAAVR